MKSATAGAPCDPCHDTDEMRAIVIGVPQACLGGMKHVIRTSAQTKLIAT